MSRLIDADALGICKANKDVFNYEAYANGWNAAIDIINNATTVDAEPIRHGEWKAEHEHTYIGNSCKEWDNFYCPFCDVPSNAPYYYCPNCGAKMDGGREKE